MGRIRIGAKGRFPGSLPGRAGLRSGVVSAPEMRLRPSRKREPADGKSVARFGLRMNHPASTLHPGIRPSCAPPLFATGVFACPLCGQSHASIQLRPRERALCSRCGHTLAAGSRFGPDTSVAFAVTGLLLAIPAMTLPLVTVAKLGNEFTGSLFTGVDALWRAGMRLLSLWVLVCGAIAPLILLGTLAGLFSPPWLVSSPRFLRWLKRLASALETWAMPEVQVLAVLVAFTKLGSLVDIFIGPGLWCYAGMAIATLIAWRTFALLPADARSARPAR